MSNGQSEILSNEFVFAVVFLNNSQQPHLSHFLVGRQHINRKFVQMKNFFVCLGPVK